MPAERRNFGPVGTFSQRRWAEARTAPAPRGRRRGCCCRDGRGLRCLVRHNGS